MSGSERLGWVVESTDNGISGGNVGSSLQAGTVNGGVHLWASTPASADGTGEAYKAAYRLFTEVAEVAEKPVLIGLPGNSLHFRFAAREGTDEHKRKTLKSLLLELKKLRPEFDLFAPRPVRDAFNRALEELAVLSVTDALGGFTDSLGRYGERQAEFVAEVRRATGS
ncbi:hypothetical protein [Kitasatospora phosalacinea]|uniref:Uncharacterized protein n=1 Tax=Kitasatospora phosalacinea TaxID=2065 RepID=A0ABW6GP82_9ACTN